MIFALLNSSQGVKVLKFIKRILRITSELTQKIRTLDDSLQYLNRQLIQDELSERDDNPDCFVDDPLDKFVLKGYYYLQNRKENDKIRRLFITSGGISLITVLAIRQKIGYNNIYEDYLVILGTSPNNYNFILNNKNIADIYSFKKTYIYMQRISSYRFVKFGPAEIDEVYVFMNLYFYTCFQKIYPYSKFILFDEGPSTCISYPTYNYSQIKKVIVHNYLEKIDFFVWHTVNQNPVIEFVDESEFDKVLSNVREKLNIVLKIENKDEKHVLVCGPGGTDKVLLRNGTVNNVINRLIQKGYKIFFKKHPRDTFDYQFIGDVKLINTTYPIELYNLDVVAVANFSESLCLTLPYFNKIAVFSKISINRKIDKPWLTGLMRFIGSQYVVPLNILLNFDHEKYSVLELKKKLFELFIKYINEKPAVSLNKNIANFIKKNQKRLSKTNFKIDKFLW
jgi:hypothetical protein